MDEQTLIPFQISELPAGPWLVFAPHPDDESFGMGGSMLLAGQQGIEIVIVIMTDGALGGDGEEERLVELRESEARQVAERLNVKQMIFWREPDRRLEISPRMVDKVQQTIKQFEPSSIFFPSPLEFHPDHRTAASLVWQALQGMAFQGQCFAYEISVQGRVNRLHDISSVAADKKDLIACYQSQLKINDYQEKVMALNRARTYSLPPEITFAEGFYQFSDLNKNFSAAIFDSLKIYWQEANILYSEKDLNRQAKPALQSLLTEGGAKMGSNPLVSVIIRTKDRPELLSEALNSLASQTYKNLEAVVVNDGGVGVSAVVAPFRDSLKLVYHHFDVNKGRAAAGNAGLETASGQFLAFLDDDDKYLPEHIENLIKVIHARPERAVYASVQALRKQGGKWIKDHLFELDFNRLRLQCVNFIPIHAVLFDRSLVEAGCRFDESFDLYEDWDFWLQVAEKTDFFHFDRVTALYRLSSGLGFGVTPDPELQIKAWQQLLSKWRLRWPVENLRVMFEQALRGLELDSHVKTYQHEIASLTHSLDQKKALLNLRDQELKAKQVHINNLDEMIDHLRQVISEKAELIEEAQKHVKQLEHESNSRLQLLNDKERELAQWRNAYEAVLASTSWRVSAPIRTLGRIWKQLKRLYRSRLHEFQLKPGEEIKELSDGTFVSTGQDPHIELVSNQGVPPREWVEIEGQLAGTALIYPVLYIDSGTGFNEGNKVFLSHLYDAKKGWIKGVVRLPSKVERLRLDPATSYGQFSCKHLQIKEIGTLQAFFWYLSPRLQRIAKSPKSLFSMSKKAWRIFRSQGWLGLKLAMVKNFRSDNEYQQWWEHYGMLFDTDREAIKSRIREMAYRPKVSILMPVFNPSELWLRKALDSVCKQLYPDWELCIADDGSTLSFVRKILEEYEQRDERIKVVFRSENGHISAASNSALALATGEYIALMDQDDELAEHALYMVAEELNRYPQAELIYSDEDKIDEQGKHHEPYFKPDWNPLLLLGQNYPSHLSVLKSERLRLLGGFRKGFEGSQDWDLIFRFTEDLPVERIRHIPHVLYHWRMIPGSTALDVSEKNYVREISTRVVKEHLVRTGFEQAEVSCWIGGYCRVRFPLPKEKPLVSLIIPTRNGYHLLHRCVETLLEKTGYPNFELIVVDNQSDDPKTLCYLDQLSKRNEVNLVSFDAPFNFSAINNYAVSKSRGEILGFLNNDLEIIHKDWLDEMVSHALRPATGAVGAMLYYPDDRIQHAGVILGVGGIANHACQGMPRGASGQLGRALLLQNLSAVTAACLIVRRSVFEEVGGFDEKDLTVAFNDVDLCLKIRQKGYWNVWTPFAELYHHESATRGREDTPEKLNRFNQEISVMLDRWGSALFEDPAYNPNLTLKTTDFSLAFPPRIHRPWSKPGIDQTNQHREELRFSEKK